MKAKFTLVESAEKNTLNVSGDLAGKANEQLRLELNSLLERRGSLELSLAQTQAMDMVALQLVYSFIECAEKSHRKLSVIPSDDQQLNTLLCRTGLMEIFKNPGTSNS